MFLAGIEILIEGLHKIRSTCTLSVLMCHPCCKIKLLMFGTRKDIIFGVKAYILASCKN